MFTYHYNHNPNNQERALVTMATSHMELSACASTGTDSLTSLGLLSLTSTGEATLLALHVVEVVHLAG